MNKCHLFPLLISLTFSLTSSLIIIPNEVRNNNDNKPIRNNIKIAIVLLKFNSIFYCNMFHYSSLFTVVFSLNCLFLFTMSLYFTFLYQLYSIYNTINTIGHANICSIVTPSVFCIASSIFFFSSRPIYYYSIIHCSSNAPIGVPSS